MFLLQKNKIPAWQTGRDSDRGKTPELSENMRRINGMEIEQNGGASSVKSGQRTVFCPCDENKEGEEK
jgi:hypothetical protein